MKNLVFVLVAFVAVSFASCGNKTSQAPVDTDSVVAVDSAAVDSAAVDSAAVDSAAVAE